MLAWGQAFPPYRGGFEHVCPLICPSFVCFFAAWLLCFCFCFLFCVFLSLQIWDLQGRPRRPKGRGGVLATTQTTIVVCVLCLTQKWTLKLCIVCRVAKFGRPCSPLSFVCRECEEMTDEQIAAFRSKGCYADRKKSPKTPKKSEPSKTPSATPVKKTPKKPYLPVLPALALDSSGTSPLSPVRQGSSYHSALQTVGNAPDSRSLHRSPSADAAPVASGSGHPPIGDPTGAIDKIFGHRSSTKRDHPAGCSCRDR